MFKEDTQRILFWSKMEFFFDEPVKPQQRANRIFLAATKGDVERFTELLETQDPFVLVNGLNCLHIACKV